jgi:hypothetical protein
VKADIERGGPRADLDLQELDSWMSKVFAFSTRARRRVSQCCAARLISGNGCSGNEGRPKAATHERNRGKAGWRKKMESRYGEVPSPLQVVTSINEASLLATAKAEKTPALDTLST